MDADAQRQLPSALACWIARAASTACGTANSTRKPSPTALNSRLRAAMAGSMTFVRSAWSLANVRPRRCRRASSSRPHRLPGSRRGGAARSFRQSGFPKTLIIIFMYDTLPRALRRYCKGGFKLKQAPCLSGSAHARDGRKRTQTPVVGG